MLPLILAAASALVPTPAADPNPGPDFVLELRVRAGDPLGNGGEPGDRVLAAPQMIVAAGQTASLFVGEESAKAEDDFVGLKAAFVPKPLADGRVAVAVDVTFHEAVPDGLRRTSTRTAVALPVGEAWSFRLAARGLADQTWFELTVRPAGPR